jgi:hypothetical protein
MLNFNKVHFTLAAAGNNISDKMTFAGNTQTSI